MFDHSMPMPLVFHNPQVPRRIPLVRGPELMMANDFVLGDFLPFGGADMMLGVDEGIADEADVRHYADEVFGGHGVPLVAVYFCVVDL